MKILGNDGYLGAYFETYGLDRYCYWGENGSYESKNIADLDQLNQEFQVDITADRFESSKDLPPMMSNSEIKEMLYSPFVRTSLIKKYGSSEEFRINGDQQWIIFSEKLYSMGFFENMSDNEILEMDNMLRHITSGIDSFNYYNFSHDYMTAGANTWGRSIGKFLYHDSLGVSAEGYYYMTKEDWMTELVSSKEALCTFNHSFVSEEKQIEFNNLIEEFYKYNSEQLVDYKSEFEKSGDHYKSDVCINDKKDVIDQAGDNESSGNLFIPSSEKNPTYIDSLKTYFLTISKSTESNRQQLLDSFPVKINQSQYSYDNVDRIKKYWHQLLKLKDKYMES